MTVQNLFNAPPTAWRRMIVDGISRALEAAFPGTVRAIYLLGSEVEGTPAAFSDVDVVVFVHDAVSSPTRGSIDAMLEALRWVSPLRLDVTVSGVEDGPFSRASADPRVKLGAEIVVGEDIRSLLPAPTIVSFREWIRPWPFEFLAVMFDGSLEHPLADPDPGDEFRGYTRVRAPNWYPAQVAAGTKEWVATVCWMATFRLAFECDRIVTSRGEAVAAFRTEIGGADAEFVSAIYEDGKRKWDYGVPTAPDDRRRLATLADTFRGFADRFLERYAGSR